MSNSRVTKKGEGREIARGTLVTIEGRTKENSFYYMASYTYALATKNTHLVFPSHFQQFLTEQQHRKSSFSSSPRKISRDRTEKKEPPTAQRKKMEDIFFLSFLKHICFSHQRTFFSFVVIPSKLYNIVSVFRFHKLTEWRTLIGRQSP